MCSESGSVIILDGPEEDIPFPPFTDGMQKEFNNWKQRRPNYQNSEFMRYLLNLSECFDVTFLVSDQDGETHRVMAHKKVLASKSEVFAARFSGRWEGEEVDLTSGEILVEDFRTFLKYLYCNEVTVTNDNVLALYHMASTYQVESMKPKCDQFLEENANEDNALVVFPFVFVHDASRSGTLLIKLAEIICGRGEDMLEKPEMLDFTEDQLSFLFRYRVEDSEKSFQAHNSKILRFGFRWIIKRFGHKKLQQFLQLDDIFKSQLSLERRFIRDKVAPFADFLSPQEIRTKQGSNMLQLPPGNPSSVYEIERFKNRNLNKQWIYRRNRSDRISFRCSESIMLLGISLYGDRRFCSNVDLKRMRLEDDAKPSKYDVDIEIYHHGRSHRKLLSTFRRAGDDMDQTTGMFNINIEPVFISADEYYTISVKMSGPPSSFGDTGMVGSLVRRGNRPILFEFQEACDKDEEAKLSNPTGVPIGQIPKLYFKLVAEEDDEVNVID